MKTNTLYFVLVALLTWFPLFPEAQAVSPPPDGGYAYNNTAEGTDALFSLTTGVWNSAFGFRALHNNLTGIRNTAIGYEALYNTNGLYNVNALDNVAVGVNALFSNTTGNSNIAIGSFALYDNTTGSNNIAIGNQALKTFTGSGNTQVGDSFSSAPDSVSVGRLPTSDHGGNLIAPGVLYASLYAEDDIYIGGYVFYTPDITYTARVHIAAQDAVYVGAVFNTPIAGSPVGINSSGQLGVAASSARFKDDIKPMDKTSEGILALKPVTFRYKQGIDPSRVTQFGLVAEEVEKVNPDLVVRDKEGKPYTVRYDQVNAMLLNEFLKEHQTVQELKSSAAKQDATIALQQKQIDALTAGLQKVSAQLELSKAAPQTALNDP